MVFGKIEYLNLLPFHVFMKRFVRSSQQRMSMHYKGGVPASINQQFISRKVDAAFISSIKAKPYKHVKLGIIARKEVMSVIVVPHSHGEKDKESASSNVLADVLGVQGKVLIGDKALRHSLEHDDYIDLAKVWSDRYDLPFVFALLCYHDKKAFFHSVERHFLKQEVKIPHYLLHKASLRTGVQAKDIRVYLRCISYDLDTKAQKGLKRFFTLSKSLR